MDAKRIKTTGKAISVRGNDIDTDRIIPARFLRCVSFEGIGEHAFEDDRKQLKEQGKTHPFDNPKFTEAEILFGNKNFGCGSSREHAPQSLNRWNRGIKAVAAESFAEIFFGNCVALGIPCVKVTEADIEKLQSANEAKPGTQFTVDVEAKTISWDGGSVPCEIADGPRQAFIEGRWDSTLELMDAQEAIAATAANLPYFNGWK